MKPQNMKKLSDFTGNEEISRRPLKPLKIFEIEKVENPNFYDMVKNIYAEVDKTYKNTAKIEKRVQNNVF